MSTISVTVGGTRLSLPVHNPVNLVKNGRVVLTALVHAHPRTWVVPGDTLIF